MFSVYGKAFAHGGAWKLPHDVLAFAAPYLVKAIYAYVDPKSEWVANGTPSWQRGLGLCFILFAVQFAGSVALHQYFDKMFDVSLRMRAGLLPPTPSACAQNQSQPASLPVLFVPALPLISRAYTP
eukprot:1561280-Rhodomonas_salina.3